MISILFVFLLLFGIFHILQHMWQALLYLFEKQEMLFGMEKVGSLA
jgi:hypothetical protein